MKLQSRNAEKRKRKVKASQDHRLVSRAANLFGISKWDVTYDHRRVAKAIHRSRLTPAQWLSVCVLEGEVRVEELVLQQLIRRINGTE